MSSPRLPFSDEMSKSERINFALLDGTAYAHSRKPSAVEYRSLFNCLAINANHPGTQAILERVYKGEMFIFWQHDQWNFVDVPGDFNAWLANLDLDTISTEDAFTPSPVPAAPTGSTLNKTVMQDLNAMESFFDGYEG